MYRIVPYGLRLGSRPVSDIRAFVSHRHRSRAMGPWLRLESRHACGMTGRAAWSGAESECSAKNLFVCSLLLLA